MPRSRARHRTSWAPRPEAIVVAPLSLVGAGLRWLRLVL